MVPPVCDNCNLQFKFKKKNEFKNCENCNEICYLSECPYCGDSNIYQIKDINHYLYLDCDECNKGYQVVKCPHCLKTNPYVSENFKKNCKSCKKSFQLARCFKCKYPKLFKNNDCMEFKIYDCDNKSCDNK
jgi:hypothetical protein